MGETATTASRWRSPLITRFSPSVQPRTKTRSSRASDPQQPGQAFAGSEDDPGRFDRRLVTAAARVGGQFGQRARHLARNFRRFGPTGRRMIQEDRFSGHHHSLSRWMPSISRSNRAIAASTSARRDQGKRSAVPQSLERWRGVGIGLQSQPRSRRAYFQTKYGVNRVEQHDPLLAHAIPS